MLLCFSRFALGRQEVPQNDSAICSLPESDMESCVWAIIRNVLVTSMLHARLLEARVRRSGPHANSQEGN